MWRSLLASLCLVAIGQAQDPLSCSSIPGASNYGTTLSVCHVADQVTLKCSQDTFGQAHCAIDHSNGFASSTDKGTTDGATIVAGLIASSIVAHRAHTAQKDFRSATDLSLRTFVLLSDVATLFKMANVRTEADKIEKLSQSIIVPLESVSDLKQEDWRFYKSPKLFREWRQVSLRAACNARQLGQILRTEMDKRIVEAGVQVPFDLAKMLEAIRADEISLDPDCSTKEALKILNANR